MSKLTWKKTAALVMAVTMLTTAAAGCGNNASSSASSEESSTSSTVESSAASATEEETDEMAAKNVADLIDAIYVQERNDNTDEECKAAKEAWDALTDAQKELVEGDNADPDYFGRDTGDAAQDDSRNEDEIGENELLVVSFGTSFNDSRVKDIKGIEDALQEAYPDWSVRRAFTAQIIINHVQARDDEKIDNMQQALDRAVANGVKNLVVQPTHLMHGAEYDEMNELLDRYKDKFENTAVAEPLLGEVGDDATVINADKEAVAKAITDEAVKTAGYDDVAAAAEDGTAFVFMGHGTAHVAKVSYSQMQTTMETLGYTNVFIGTVEGEPEDTSCEAVIEKVKEAGFTKVVLRPLMVVAGDHANNDMAGDDEDSWLSQFKAADCFDSVDTQIAGLGEIGDVQQIYIEDALQEAYPDWSVRRAFTAQIIINHVQARDDEKIDNMQQALDRAVANGVKNLVVQPTHLMHGAEYDEMNELLDRYKDKFENTAVAEPLLGEVGDDATVINADKEAVAKAITDEAVKTAGYDDVAAAAEDGTAFVFMGHGTAHVAKVSYSQMQTTMETLGYTNVFIGTVEGEPEDTSCEAVIEKVKEAGFTKVVLRPLMVVAGDHANNDMAGDDEDSWLSQFKAADCFDSVDTQIAGLGEIGDVQQIYIDHAQAAIDSLNG